MLKDTFKAPCLVALNMYLTLHLLLFVVLIARRIKYLILSQGKIYLIANQDNMMIGLWFVLKKIVCKDNVFLAFKVNENLNFCTMMYRMAMPNVIDCCNNQTLHICIATTHFDSMGLKCCI